MEKRIREYGVEIAETKLSVVIDEDEIRLDGAEEPIRLRRRHRLRSLNGVLADGTDVPIYVEETDEEHEYTVYVRGEAIPVRVSTERDERLAALSRTSAISASQAQTITAPMPGMLKQILVAEGQVVDKGESLLILEAMKMENEIKSPGRLRVTRLVTQPGTAVEKGTRLIELGPVE
jgi:biotin carboxyl carrier protein